MPSDASPATSLVTRIGARAGSLAWSALLISLTAFFLNEVAIPLAAGVFITYIFMKTATDVMSLPLVRTFAIFVVFLLGTGLSYWLLSKWLGAVPSLSSLAHQAWTILIARLGAGTAMAN